jgi:hypothetical protein
MTSPVDARKGPELNRITLNQNNSVPNINPIDLQDDTEYDPCQPIVKNLNDIIRRTLYKFEEDP